MNKIETTPFKYLGINYLLPQLWNWDTVVIELPDGRFLLVTGNAEMVPPQPGDTFEITAQEAMNRTLVKAIVRE